MPKYTLPDLAYDYGALLLAFIASLLQFARQGAVAPE